MSDPEEDPLSGSRFLGPMGGRVPDSSVAPPLGQDRSPSAPSVVSRPPGRGGFRPWWVGGRCLFSPYSRPRESTRTRHLVETRLPGTVRPLDWGVHPDRPGGSVGLCAVWTRVSVGVGVPTSRPHTHALTSGFRSSGRVESWAVARWSRRRQGGVSTRRPSCGPRVLKTSHLPYKNFRSSNAI